MQLTGFALKKGKKKALAASVGFSAAAPTAPQTAEKVFVTDFDPSAPAELPADGKPPLVIPLVETNAWSVTATTEEIATQKAAKQLIEEAKAAEQTTEGNTAALVISSDREKKRTELFQDGTNRAGPNGNKKPILQQNAVPGLDQMADVTDKYRHDVALRPDAPDVHSDVYESVPVEAFGAALLRGMGWKGSVDADDVREALQPRHKLLGLGATKRPKVPGAEDKNKKRKKHKKQQEEQEEKTTERRSGFNTDRIRSSREEKDQRRGDDSRDRRKRSRSRSRDRRGRDHDRERKDQDRDRDRDRDRQRDRRNRSDRRSRSRSRDRRSRRR